MANILLSHGILGFGSVFPNQPLNYFNGIKSLFEAEGHEVLCPSVAPLGSLARRASQLEQQIAEHRWRNADGPIHTAKKAETRAARIAETARLARTNERANQWRDKRKG